VVSDKGPTAGSYSDLEIMRTVDIEFSSPSIEQQSYPIRRLDVEKLGGALRYTIFAGLGSTPPEEEQGRMLRDLYYRSQKIFTDRLVNTPWSEGAAINWSDIGGADTGARSAVVEDAAYGGGWDGDGVHAPSQNAIYDELESHYAGGDHDGRYYTEAEVDADIAAHHAADSPDHDDRYYTEAEVDAIESGLQSEVDSDISAHAADSDAHHAKYTDSEARSAVVEDAAFSDNWAGDADHAPSQNAVHDELINIQEDITTLKYCLDYAGTWDASSGADPDASPDDGDYWIVTTAGTRDFGSYSITFAVNDWAVYESTSARWHRVRRYSNQPTILVTPSGVNDSIESAIAQVLNMGGGKVIIGAGTFDDGNENFPISIDDGGNGYYLEVEGMGDSTIIEGGIGVDNIGKARIHDLKLAGLDINAEWVWAEYLTFIGDGDREGTGIHIGADHVRIRDCYFENLSKGIASDPPTPITYAKCPVDAIIKDCEFYDCTAGFYSYSVKSSIKDNYFHYNFNGIVWGREYCTDNVVSDNRFVDHTETDARAINFGQYNPDTNLFGLNFFDNNYYDFYGDDYSNITFGVTAKGGSLLPVGTIIMYNGSGIANVSSRSSQIGDDGSDTITMEGWYVCNGNASTPDLMDKFIRSESSAGNTGGEDSHTLTTSEIPSHRHQIRGYNVQNANKSMETIVDDDRTDNVQTDYTEYTGGGSAHENRPAYYSLIFIIRMS
jgi:hypothetical protein